MNSPESKYDLVPTHLAIEAMRDNGYRNTAYAVAELIDNSIQAGAKVVELLCSETENFVQQRTRRGIKQLGVLDNGSGMNADVLRMSLQFGNGTHLSDRAGIGRFGMGLPSASISQCKLVEVWSWTNGGHENALYSFINLDEVAAGTMREVPNPVAQPLPKIWVDAASEIGPSGTLVVWSKMDRCMWKTAHSIIRNSEFLIARLYRRFITTGRVAIRLAAFTEDTPTTFTLDELAQANDPGYLITPSSTPAPYDDVAMFQHEGESWEVPIEVEFEATTHTIFVRFSVAKDEPRSRPNAGSTDYGKHAGRNVGVSLIRADRELDMDQALVNGYDTRERWWGVEVDFPASLDGLFGVTNNKQAARNFSEIAMNFKSLAGLGGGSYTEFRESLDDDSDPSGPLLDIVTLIDRRLNAVRKLINIQQKGSGKRRKRYDPNAPEVTATEATDERKQEGHVGESDAGESLPKAARKKELTDELVETGLSHDHAEELAARTIDDGIKYTFAVAHLEGRSFFTVKPVAGEIVIKLNVNHPAYKNLVEVLEDEPDEELSEDQIRSRLEKANRGLKLLLMAWARLEDEQPSEAKREDIQELRYDWGKVAARFLKSD